MIAWVLATVLAAGEAHFPVNWRDARIPPSASWHAPARLPGPPRLASPDDPSEAGFRALVLACDRNDVAACVRAAERLRAPHVRSDDSRTEKLLGHACELHFATCVEYAGFLLERDGLTSADAKKILDYRCYAYGYCAEAAWLTMLQRAQNYRIEAVKVFARHPLRQNPAEGDIAYAKAVNDCDHGDTLACLNEHEIALRAVDPTCPTYAKTPTFIPGPATKIRKDVYARERKEVHAMCYDKGVAEACATDKVLKSRP